MTEEYGHDVSYEPSTGEMFINTVLLDSPTWKGIN
jgi:hypothetical protein